MNLLFLLLLFIPTPEAVFQPDPDPELSVFVDEIGETDIISIDKEPEVRAKRQAATPPLDSVPESGSGDDYYDLDDEDKAEIDINPSGVSPTWASSQATLLSPSFDGISTRSMPSSYDSVEATRSFISRPFDAFRSSSVAHYDEIEEGSGNEAYDYSSSIMPSRPSGSIVEATMTYSPYDEEEQNIPVDRVENRGPVVQRRLQKYPVTAGKSIRILIPEDTFFDQEDGNTRNLRLDLRHENGSVVRNTWLRFDPKKQALYALPVNENIIGQWKFKLIASDKEGKSVDDTLEIMVRQYKRSRLVNHQFNIEFSFHDWDPASTRNWQWSMLDKIQRLYGDRKPTNIIVRQTSENPFIFGWMNHTLTQQSCPKGQVRDLFDLLVEGDAKLSGTKMGNPSPRLKMLLGKHMYAKSVKVELLGTCLENEPKSPLNPEIESDDTPPVMRNPIDRINVTAGELLRHKVPPDTCYDKEDGGTRRLQFTLLTPSRKQLAPDAWLQFDTRNQEFVGIPLEEEVGRSEYQLVCSDRNGLSAVDGIEIIVHNRPFSESYPIEFALTFDEYSGFASRKVRIVEIIAAFFGDSGSHNVVVKTFDKDENRIVWFNKTLAHRGCKDQSIVWMRNYLMEQDGRMNPDLAQAFQPYLKLVDVEAIKKNRCAFGSVPTPTRPTNSEDRMGDGTFLGGMIPSTDYLLTFIIPAVIITCMLILAILLACLLHKKRKAGKLNLFYSESLPPRVPVILQDELYDNEHEHGVFKQPVMVPDDTMHGIQNPHEMDRLLQHPVAPVSIDPFSKGSLSRPTPAYQRRQQL